MLGLGFLAVGSPAFATASVKVASGTSGTTIDLSFVKNAVNLIVGVFAGGFVLNAAILGGFMFVINYVFGSMTGKDAGGAGADGAAEDFFVALKGAIVSTTI